MQCYRPVRLVKRLDDAEFASEFFVPCGKCYACLQNKQQDWVNRMVEEQKHSVSSYFVTLTYDDDNIPYVYTNALVNSFAFEYSYELGLVYECCPTLLKSDVQKFMKRFRKALHKCKCRFFLAGEYGSLTCRPHYHLCLFLDDYVDLSQLDDILNKTWKFGFHQISDLKEQRIAYCVKYLVKGGKHPEHAQKPFCLMSRCPGIGEQYIDQDSYDYHLNHHYLVKVGGFKQRLPRYWKDKMCLDNEMVVSDRLELEYRKDHEWDPVAFGQWRKKRLDHMESRIEKKLTKTDII